MLGACRVAMIPSEYIYWEPWELGWLCPSKVGIFEADFDLSHRELVLGGWSQTDPLAGRRSDDTFDRTLFTEY